MSAIQISGQWVTGSNMGERATLFEARAGLVYGLRADGTFAFGAPGEFVADTGETGEALLKLLLTNPRASTLIQGTVREALAAVYSVATLGQQETRAWDQYYRYVVDDGEGSCGVVNFNSNGVVGALNRHDFQRSFDVDSALALAPTEQQEALRSLTDLPIFQCAGHRALTSVFWTDGDILSGPEAWYKIYTFGGELLRRELMEGHAWRAEASEYYGLNEPLTTMILQITERLVPLNPISLREEELSVLITKDAPFRAEALEQLFSGGVFRSA